MILNGRTESHELYLRGARRVRPERRVAVRTEFGTPACPGDRDGKYAWMRARQTAIRAKKFERRSGRRKVEVAGMVSGLCPSSSSDAALA